MNVEHRVENGVVKNNHPSVFSVSKVHKLPFLKLAKLTLVALKMKTKTITTILENFRDLVAIFFDHESSTSNCHCSPLEKCSLFVRR